MASSAHATAFTGDVNDWTLNTYQFGPFAAASFVSGTVYPLFVLPEACDIEKITVRYSTGSTSGTALFKADASGTAPGGGTALTAAESLAPADIAINTTKDLAFVSTNPQIDLASGTLISVTSGGTVTNLVGMIFTIVTRKKPTRRDSSTDAQKIDKTRFFYTKN